MQLNKNKLNSIPLNSAFTGDSSNTFEGVFASFEQDIITTVGETTIPFFALVAFTNVNEPFLKINQVVELRDAIGYRVFPFYQNIINPIPASVPIIINNQVGDQDIRYGRVGYEVEITMGNYTVPPTLLTGKFSYKKTTGQATSCSFTLLNKKGIQNPKQYQGKPVKVKIRTNEGKYDVFSGYVDVPSIDLIEEKTTFTCSDRRNTRIKKLAIDLSTVGIYSSIVFGDPTDKLDELTKRLSTIPYDFDFTNSGQPAFTAWTPSASPHFSLTGTPGPYNQNKVYYSKPEVTWSDASVRINTIRSNLNHSFVRLHQQNIDVNWKGYSDGGPAQWYVDWKKGSFPQRSTVESSARAGNWILPRGINFVPLWTAQGFQYNGITVIWQPDKKTEWKREKQEFAGYLKESSTGRLLLDKDGFKIPIYRTVKDSQGRVVMEVYRTEIENTSIYQCIGATWLAARKFSQNVIEHFNFNFTVPSSVAQFEEVLSEENYSVTSEYNIAQWEQNKSMAILSDNSAYIDRRENIIEVNKALITMINKAKTSLKEAHRDVRVVFQRSIWPQIDVIHTVSINIQPLECIGRVGAIEHAIDFLTGQGITTVTLYLSQSHGTDTDTSAAVNPFINDDPSYIGSTNKRINLGTHLGTDPDEPGAPSISSTWNGWIGNWTIDGTQDAMAFRTTVGERFIVDYPAIEEILTNNRDLYKPINISVNIPNDYIVIRSEVYSE